MATARLEFDLTLTEIHKGEVRFAEVVHMDDHFRNGYHVSNYQSGHHTWTIPVWEWRAFMDSPVNITVGVTL
jgi:hypothetical protein